MSFAGTTTAGISVPVEALFADKWVAFAGGSGDNAACFQSRIFRSASPGGF